MQPNNGLMCALDCRDHPELSEALCEEMMTRQLELADKVSQHPVLACLGPWMENLTISPHWRGTWCERLLKSMYYVTLRCAISHLMIAHRLRI